MSNTNGKIRILQYNILADGLSRDGFVCSDTLETVSGETKNIPEFLDELKQIKGDREALNIFAKNYNTPNNTAIYESCLKWIPRWGKILKLIEDNDPDIIVLEEMDHYADALEDLKRLGYVSTFEKNIKTNGEFILPYVPMWTNPSADSDSYLHMLREQSYAFIPKLFSKARKFALKRGMIDADNDGCTIFWKRNRFELKKIEFCQFLEYQSHDKDEDGAMAVVLEDLKNNTEVCVITSHLPSGQTRERELERLEILSDTSRGVFREFISNMMRENDNVIIALDANSDPLETYDETGKESGNVWQSFHDISNLKGVWDHFFCNRTKKRPVTVNKIRGPSSNQPKKIGIHSLELIDHIFYSDSLHFSGFVTPVMIFNSREDSLNELIPNRKEASDHYPIIADFTYI